MPVDITVRFLVYKIEFRPGGEVIRLFIDPPSGTEPGDSQAALTVRDVSPFQSDTVELVSANGDPPERLDLDDLRIATSFRNVIPAATSTHALPVPAP